MTLLLIAAISVVSALAFSQQQIMHNLQFNAYKIVQGKQLYRLITHAFVHANWEHLLVNMIVLYSFGTAVEQFFGLTFGDQGRSYYLFLIFGSVIFSTLYSLYQNRKNPYYNAVGASGAVSAVLFTAIFFDPWNNIYFFGILPIPGIIFGGLYLYYSYYMSTKKADNIGHDAHFLGAVFGFLLPIVLKPALLIGFLDLLLGRIGM
jgi:membrane associated rhomboid family serine protease